MPSAGVALDLQDEESGMASWLDNLDSELQAELQEIISNSKLSEMYLSLARDLDVMEPKLPDEVPILSVMPALLFRVFQGLS